MAEGMDEQQGNVWTLPMPTSAAVHESFLDDHDCCKLFERGFFQFGENFCILANRVHALPSVNTENAVVN